MPSKNASLSLDVTSTGLYACSKLETLPLSGSEHRSHTSPNIRPRSVRREEIPANPARERQGKVCSLRLGDELVAPDFVRVDRLNEFEIRGIEIENGDLRAVRLTSIGSFLLDDEPAIGQRWRILHEPPSRGVGTELT